MLRKAILGAVLSAGLIVGTASASTADQPGPGDKQCVPGQQGNPHPGFKAGACNNR